MTRGMDIGAIPEFRDSQLIRKYREQESDLLSQETVLTTTVPEGHPSLIRLRAQLRDLRLNIDVEAQRIIAAIQIDNLIKEVRDLETKALDQSANEVELRQLEREAQANRVLYESFLGRQQETSAQEDLQGADARVLSSAEPPNNPESQRARRTLLLSLILGTAAGVGIVVLLDRLNNTYRHAGHHSRRRQSLETARRDKTPAREANWSLGGICSKPAHINPVLQS